MPTSRSVRRSSNALIEQPLTLLWEELPPELRERVAAAPWPLGRGFPPIIRVELSHGEPEDWISDRQWFELILQGLCFRYSGSSRAESYIWYCY